MKLDHFKMSEFECPCCGESKMDNTALLLIDLARTYANIPFVIKPGGGYRCKKHNAEIGGAKLSSHCVGKGFDISTNCADVPNSLIAFKVMEWCRTVGFTRFALYENHIHVDYDTDKTPNVLIYGKY